MRSLPVTLFGVTDLLFTPVLALPAGVVLIDLDG